MNKKEETIATQETQMVSGSNVNAQQKPNSFISIAPFLFAFVMLYFLLIRPQQKKQKEQAKMLNAMKIGDKIVLSCGIIGVILEINLESKLVTIATDENGSNLTICRSAINEILPEHKTKDDVKEKNTKKINNKKDKITNSKTKKKK